MFKYPYTNLHELNLDWILDQIKNFGTDLARFEDTISETVKQELSKYIIDGKLDVFALFSGFVNIRQFNPHADGVTDDVEAFSSAINFCNTYGVDLHLNAERYYISSSLPVMKQSVYGNGAVIVAGASHEPYINIFSYDFSERDYIVSALSISKTAVTDPALFNKIFDLETDVSIGLRGGEGEELFYKQTLVTDAKGNFINCDLSCTPINSCVATKIRTPNFAKQIYFGDITIEYGNYGGSCLLGLVSAIADNMLIRNINVTGSIVTNEYAYSVIRLDRSTGCVIENVNGMNPVPNTGSGYIIHITGGSDNVVRNCVMGTGPVESWGAVGCNYLTNTKFENITSNRVDCHYMAFGNFVIEKCNLNYIALPDGGSGVTTIAKCSFVGSNFNLVQRRNDLNICYNGTIIVDGCYCGDKERTHNVLAYPRNAEALTANIDFSATTFIINNFTANTIRSLMTLVDGGFYNAANSNIIIKNTTINTDSNTCWFRAYTERVDTLPIKMINCSFLTRNSYLGSEKNISFTFVNCNFDSLQSDESYVFNTAVFIGCKLKQPGAYTLKELIVIGCIINATSATRFSGTTEKFVGNICAGYDSAWNT